MGMIKFLFHSIRNRINTRDMVVVLTITIASLLVYGDLTFRPNTFLMWSDAPFEFFADEVSHKILNSWDFDNLGFGFPSIYRGQTIYFALEWLLLIFLPAWVVNRIIYLLPLLLRGFSMYYLLSTFIRRNDSISTFCKLLPSIFFVAIPLDVYVFPANSLYLAFTTLVMALFIRGTLSDYKTTYIWLGALCSIVLFGHPVLLTFTFILLFFYLIPLIAESRKRVALLSYSLKFLASVVLFNIITLFPLLMLHESTASYLTLSSSLLSEANLIQAVPFTKLIFVSRMMVGNQASALYFSSPVMVLLGFFMVAYCYTSVFLMGSKEYRVRVFARWLIISALCVTLFATGVAYPISGSIYLFFYRAIPGLLYNVTHLLYPLSILYTCMLGLTTYLIVEHIRSLSLKRRCISVLLRKLLAVIIIGIAVVSVIAYVYPVYTPALGFRGNLATQIPEEYYQLHDLLRTENVDDYRLFIYPPVDHFVSPTWSDQTIPIVDIVDKFSPIPAVVWRAGLGKLVIDKQGPGELVQRALLDLDRADMYDAVRVLGILSVRYIFVHKDIPSVDWARANRTLSSSPDITLVKDSKNYMLFEIDKSLLVPMVYAVSATDINATGFVLNPTSLIRGHAISSGDYIIPIPEGKEIVVVLNQAYSSDWILSGHQLQSMRMLVNGFANGWHVKSTEATDVHVILISNVWASVGVTLSIVSITAFTIVIFRRSLGKAMRRLLKENIYQYST